MSLVTPLRRVNGHTTGPGTLAEAVARGESTAGHRQSPAIMPRGSLAGHLFTDQPPPDPGLPEHPVVLRPGPRVRSRRGRRSRQVPGTDWIDVRVQFDV